MMGLGRKRFARLFSFVWLTALLAGMTTGLQPAAADGPGFAIATASGSVNSTSVQVTGTSVGISKPMWYEVYSGAGAMTDFGAFAPDSNWKFIARRLNAGNNTVKVYAQNGSGTIDTQQIVLNLPVGVDPAVRPRPQPAELWWGGLGNLNQLVQPGADWDFVKQNADAFFLHTAMWGPQNDGLLQGIVQQLKPYGTKFVAELGGYLGFQNTNDQSGWPQWEYDAWGGGGFIKDKHDNSGLILSEITHDFHFESIKDIAREDPNRSHAQIVDRYADLWDQYVKKNNASDPYLKTSITQSPIWWNWQNYPALRGESDNVMKYDPLLDLQGNPIVVNGHTVSDSFNAYEIMSALDAKAKVNPTNSFWGFFSDNPYYTRLWGEGTTNEGQGMRAKIIAYEQWMHSVGDKHTFVANEDPGNALAQSDPNEWNRQFTENSMKSMIQHQKEGGRADRYLFESWYTLPDGTLMPSAVTPESDPHTYTGLTEAGIVYLKGIKPSDGTPEPLDLALSTGNGTATLTLTNIGDAVSMPALVAINGSSVTWRDASGANITAAMNSDEGWVDTGLLQPGQSVTITGTIPTQTPASTVSVEAFWNPQDPTGIVRDRVKWTPDGTSADPQYYRLINKNSGKALDVTDGSSVDGANVQQWTNWNGAGQQWSLEPTGGGSFKLRNRASGKLLEVAGGSAVPGANVQQWTDLNGTTQQWKLLSSGDGYYRIQNLNSNLMLDVDGASNADGANVQQWTDNGCDCQQWVLEPVGNVKLINVNSGKALEVAGASLADFGDIQQWEDNGCLCQSWQFVSLTNGFFRIENQNSGKVIDVGGGSNANGTNIAQLVNLNNSAQKWRLEFASDGSASLRPQLDALKAMEVYNWSTSNGGEVVLWDATGAANQNWRLLPSGH